MLTTFTTKRFLLRGLLIWSVEYLVVGAEDDHEEADGLHAPLDEVESARVGGRPHPVDDGEADQASQQDVAHHQVEILLGQVLLDVVPRPDDSAS